MAGSGKTLPQAPNGWFAVMPVIHDEVMGVKTVTFYPGNAELGLHTHMAVVELLRRATGEPLVLMDGRLITEMRTAAVSSVALDALAQMGQRLFFPPNVAGWPGAKNWLTSGTMIARQNFLTRLLNSQRWRIRPGCKGYR